MRSRALVTAVGWTLAAMLASTPSACALAPRVVEYPVSGAIGDMTAGPDGNVWFTEPSDPGRIGFVTPSGAVTELTGGTTPGLPAGTTPAGIAAGPDGRLWVAQYAFPGELSAVTTGGSVSQVAVNGVTPGFGRQPLGITAGPGGLWMVNTPPPGGITRVTTAGAATQVATGGSTPGFTGNASPFAIVAGADGNLWFNETSYVPSNPLGIVRLTPGGAVTEFRPATTPGLTGAIGTLAPGADGNVWFTAARSVVGRITPGGAVKEFWPGVAPGFSADAAPLSITRGPDGAMWFTWDSYDPTQPNGAQYRPGGLSRINAAGEVMEFRWNTTGGMEEGPLGDITSGADGNIWYGFQTHLGGLPGHNHGIARFTTFFSRPPPTLRTVSVVPPEFRLGSPRARAVSSRSSAQRGTTIRFTLRHPGRIRLGFMTAKRRGPMGSIDVQGKRGLNVVRFTGRTDQGPLPSGRFKVEVTVTDPATDMSTMLRAPFKVVG